MRLVSCLTVAILLGGSASSARAQNAEAADTRAQSPTIGPLPAPMRRPVTLSMRDVPLVDAIQEIDRQADLQLGYTDRLLQGRRVTIRVSDVPASEALSRVLAGTGIVARVTEHGHIVLVAAPRPTAAADTAQPTGAILGRITDSLSGKPVMDASVTVRGMPVEFRTTDSGYYFFQRVPVGEQTVVARMVGYRPVMRRVIVFPDQQTRADIKFVLGMTRLLGVVTTATGPQRRLELGNDITVLNADSITSTQLVRNVSDLIATRVPGLTAMATSGAPGDPTRLRLRGLHSVLQSDDPIVIVDGVRVYADQSADRSGNLAAKRTGVGTAPPAPSPIDQIDPNSIETLEVLKGPSAATMYGADAANGVIVITTRHGHPGPARWSVSGDYGQTTLPGSWPTGYFRWGHPLATSGTQYCALRDQTCALDSVSRFQLLNDPRFSILGKGTRAASSVGVSGGNQTLTYDVTGSVSDETGLLRLPSYEVGLFAQQQGAPAPGWMVRPHHYQTWSANAGISAHASPKLDIGIHSMLTRGEQDRSSLEDQLGSLERIYVDSSGKSVYQASGSAFTYRTSILGDFYKHTTDQATTFTNGLNVVWRPLSWLTASTDAGLNYIQRDDRVVVPRGLPGLGVADTVGTLRVGEGMSMIRSVNAGLTAQSPSLHGVRLQTSVGANYTSTSLADVALGGTDLVPGTTSLDGIGALDPPTENRSDRATMGWYVEPMMSIGRMWLSTGVRIDGGSTFGTHASMPAFPKVSYSYLISDEPFFPFKKLFNTLRLRAAYGQAGVQPGVGDRLRLYQQQMVWLDSQFVSGTVVKTLGNSRIRPERSRELEGGFDADMLGDRLSLQLSGYRNTRIDALVAVPVAPSVYGNAISDVLENVGVIRNTGVELQLTAEPVQTDLVSLGGNLLISRNRNLVVSLARGVTPFFNPSGDGRVIAGYPLYGRWARPIIGYRDLNGDGLITANEVQVGDSAVFMGESMPNYTAAFGTHAGFLRGHVTVDAEFSYTNGLTQINETARQDQVFSQAMNDPNAPFGEQAAVAVMNVTPYGIMQTVSTLRFDRLSIGYALPQRYAQLVGAQSLGVAIQGANLGLHTNYRGKDPNVNAYSSGTGVVDSGVLPVPRTWQIRISATH